MNPSIVLAAALAASISLPAFGQTAPCARKDGAPAAAADKSPDAPYDAAGEAFDEAFWTRAKAAGVKLDAETCRLRGADAHVLTRREVEALKSKPGAKDPKPKESKELTDARAAFASAGLGGAAGTDADSKKRFDGANAIARGVSGIPVPTSDPNAPLPAEARLTAALNADLQKKFAEEETGRRLLEHFTAPDGTVRLPGVTLEDYGESAMAVYDRPSGLINLNQREAVKSVVASAPEGERAKLARRLADPAKLSAYLVEHSEARAALLDAQAGTFFHETFHAWQQRRDPKIDAVDGRDPVEWEREAFREELHYFHERVMRDPSLADRSPDLDMYKRLLGGYPEFKKYVTELYQNSFGSESFPTVEQLLAKRAQAGRAGAASGLENLKRMDAEYQTREADFAEKVLPAMQNEAYPKLIARKMEAGRPAQALALAASAPENIRTESGPKAFAATLAYLQADPPPALADRLDAWDAYLAYQTRTTGSNKMAPEIFATYARDCRAEVEARLAEAKAARTKQGRSDALDWAKFYAGILPDKAALLKRIGAVR